MTFLVRFIWRETLSRNKRNNYSKNDAKRLLNFDFDKTPMPRPAVQPPGRSRPAGKPRPARQEGAAPLAQALQKKREARHCRKNERRAAVGAAPSWRAGRGSPAGRLLPGGWTTGRGMRHWQLTRNRCQQRIARLTFSKDENRKIPYNAGRDARQRARRVGGAMLNYDEQDQKLILRVMAKDFLALLAIDLETDDYEVIYSNGAYKEYAPRYRRKRFFDAWLHKGIPLIVPEDRERMKVDLAKDHVLNQLATHKEYETKCQFVIQGKPTHCRIKAARDVLEPGVLVLSIRDIEDEMKQERECKAYQRESQACEAAYEELQQRLKVVHERIRVLMKRQQKRIYIRMFGRFTVLLDGTPVLLRGKAKEILALVVSKCGKEISNEEIYRTIWENRSYSNANMSVYYNALGRLRKALDSAGISDLLISTAHGQMANTSLFDCDYYEWLDGVHADDCAFEGEFLSEYSWGEYILGSMMRELNSTPPTR